VAVEAAEPLGVPVFPALAFGLSPAFLAYPGTVSLRTATYVALIRDILDSLTGQGFRRVLIVNGHGGNEPARAIAAEWMADHPGSKVRLHNWWSAPRTWATVQEIDPAASHASWMENYPWTRLTGVVSPDARKPMCDLARLRTLAPKEVRAAVGDGNYGGRYRRADDEMLTLWRVGVEETRAQLAEGWD